MNTIGIKEQFPFVHYWTLNIWRIFDNAFFFKLKCPVLITKLTYNFGSKNRRLYRGH